MKRLYNISLAITLISGLAILSSFTLNKTEGAAFVTNLLPMWETSKMHTLEVLDAMPEDKFSYKPTEVSKTFGTQMVHIGYTLKYFTAGMIKGKNIPHEEPDASTMSKAEIRALVSDGFDTYISAIKELAEDDLAVELPFGPERKITRKNSILFAHDHVTNHRAKANLYIRMNDIDPPSYKF
jgi:uncharacterized damage-inducible protein DinB